MTRFALCISVVCAGLAFGTGSASAWTWKTLHNFCAWNYCNDGLNPASGLVMGRSGNLFGTTDFSDKSGFGLVFEYNPGTSKFSVVHLVYDADAQNTSPACNLQFSCISDLIVDSHGALYGTTQWGGKYFYGVVFQLKYNGTKWQYSVLHDFGAVDGYGGYFCDAFGGNPIAGLTYAGQSSGAPWDGSSPLFGTNSCGGKYGNGIAYKLTHKNAGWRVTAIHAFQGSYPNALVMDSSGNLFGTTVYGGKSGYGLMFKLAAGTWTETVLKNFCVQRICADGAAPYGRLLIDAAGNLFGTTSAGGAGANCQLNGGCGIAFERPSGGGYQPIYNFCSLANCADGEFPSAGLIMDGAGNLFGTAQAGGTGADCPESEGCGLAFELVNRNGAWSETTIHPFCNKANCPDGYYPETPLVLDGSGNLFGTAYFGGAQGSGTLLRLTP